MTAVRELIDFAQMQRADVRDDGGKLLDAILCPTADIAAAVSAAVSQDFAVMPAGGLTSAINCFDYDKPVVTQRYRDVVAVRPKGALDPERVAADTPIEAIQTHQIAIDRAACMVTAGAGLTFSQVNAVLAEDVGPNVRVLIDLTSVASAWVGGVIATGGMGPMRTRPSATCDAICVADGGDKPRIVTGSDIIAYEGLQGWAGMITAARMRYYEVPAFEFGLVLPMQSSDTDGMADLLAYLHPWTAIDLGNNGKLTGQAENTILNGIELISRQALEKFIEHASDPARTKAQGLLQSCEYASADMLVCLTGWSDVSVDEVLCVLMDEETETIGGVSIDYGIGFSSGSEMETFRAIREGAPDIARTQARVLQAGKLRPWTTSSDINIVTPRDSTAIANILTAYEDYRQAIAELGQRYHGRLEVHLSAYGHLNPQGIDPHHRVTLIAPEGGSDALEAARKEVTALKKALIQSLVKAAVNYGSVITGGEKGLPSAVEIARAVGGEDKAPENLRAMIDQGRKILAQAPASFTFRASPELRP